MSAIAPTGRPGPSGSGRPVRRQWSISAVLAWGFGLLMVIAVGSVLYFGLRSALENTLGLMNDRVVLIVRSVTERARLHLEPARSVVEHLARLAEDGVFEPGDEETLFTHLAISLAAAPQIRAAIFIDAGLEARLLVRTTDGLVRQTADWRDYPPVVRTLPRLLAGDDRARWGEVIHVPEIDGPGTEGTVLNVSVPVRRGGRLVGIFAASVRVGELSTNLGRFRSGYGETPFILAGRERVLAHPGLAAGVSDRSAERPLPARHEVGDPVLSLLWDGERSRSSRVAELVPMPSGMEARVIEAGPERGRGPPSHVVVFEQVPGFGTEPWIVGCHFRLEDIGGELARLRGALVAGLAVLVVAVVAALLYGRILRLPVQRLAAAAERLRIHGPGDLEDLPGSSVRELDSAARAFNEMAEGLRDRELVRETFGKYVPRGLLGDILVDRGVLAPTTRVATVLFTDIAGFSAVSERLSPRRLIEVLNEYFSAVVESIERHGGVIQQFQGDAILATFNLPVEDPEHAANAVRTALEIQAVLVGRRFGVADGDPGMELPTRVGINTGTVVGGTVGAAGRLGYTVHGDEVNLAARIEQLNKEYGSSILIARSTMVQAGSGFRFEPIGEVPIRGRRRGVTVYRVVE